MDISMPQFWIDEIAIPRSGSAGQSIKELRRAAAFIHMER